MIRKIGIIVWKTWFFSVVVVTTLFFSLCAIALSFLLGRYAYRPMHLCAKGWGCLNLWLSGICWHIDARSFPLRSIERQAIFIANHTSIIDIFLLLALIPHRIMFIGKASLGRFPIFGYAYAKINILVDRKDPSSQKAVVSQARHFMRERHRSLAIFPEGGIPKHKTRLAPFKSGPFSLALSAGCPLVPITLDRPARLVSYAFLSGGPGRVRVRIHPPIPTADHTPF